MTRELLLMYTAPAVLKPPSPYLENELVIADLGPSKERHNMLQCTNTYAAIKV